MDLKYIVTVLVSLSHELGHAKCILRKAKKTKLYNDKDYVVIAFGDYIKGQLLPSWFYPHFLCHKKKSDIRICLFSNSNAKINPITLSSYYAGFGDEEIIACAKAGWRAEFKGCLFSLGICVMSFRALSFSNGNLLYAIPAILFGVSAFIKFYFFCMNFKKDKKGNMPKDLLYSKSPSKFDKLGSLNDYNNVYTRISK